MKQREEQAFTDGKLAFAEGKFRGQCLRKSRPQRAAWKAGWDEAERLALLARATPAQIDESNRVLALLKEWTKTL